MYKSVPIYFLSQLKGESTLLTLLHRMILQNIFSFVSVRSWICSSTNFVFCLLSPPAGGLVLRLIFSFFLIIPAFGQNIQPPEFGKGALGLRYGMGRVPYTLGKVVPHLYNLPPENQKHRNSMPRIFLPGVRRLVPQEYPSIQTAINDCEDGDTVLVSEGTYFENIRYKGKAIVVTSNYLIDGDTTHISQTIIDGSNPSNPDSGSVVYFIDGEDTTSVLCGLTITKGTGTRSLWFGIWYRMGGGVYCESSGARIIHNRIIRNQVIDQAASG